jgi:hypothetical protein
MKINFREGRFQQLLLEAKSLNVSIPKLIDIILEAHYTNKYSHKGVNKFETEIRERVPTDPERNTNTYKN